MIPLFKYFNVKIYATGGLDHSKKLEETHITVQNTVKVKLCCKVKASCLDINHHVSWLKHLNNCS